MSHNSMINAGVLAAWLRKYVLGKYMSESICVLFPQKEPVIVLVLRSITVQPYLANVYDGILPINTDSAMSIRTCTYLLIYKDI